MGRGRRWRAEQLKGLNVVAGGGGTPDGGRSMIVFGGSKLRGDKEVPFVIWNLPGMFFVTLFYLNILLHKFNQWTPTMNLTSNLV
jgi:hypothetical protein